MMEYFFDAKQLATWKTFLMKEGTTWALNIVAALTIFFVGKWLVKKLVALLKKAMIRAKMDPTLASFLSNILNVLLIAFVVIAAITKIGIETSSLAAIFAAAGLAIGLSMQNSLSNLAAGIMIILFRPIKVGDYVEAGGAAGIVEEVSIFTTKFRSVDNLEIIVPNGSIISGVITNYNAKSTRRLDLTFGISYGDDIRLAKDILNQAISADVRILAEPAPVVAVSDLGESAVNFVVRPWVKTEDYWDVRFALTEEVKSRFDAAGITIPFPQRVINVNHLTGKTEKTDL
jgi:small conductance mechanosensitive channel